jgi:hypothetical protein
MGRNEESAIAVDSGPTLGAGPGASYQEIATAFEPLNVGARQKPVLGSR